MSGYSSNFRGNALCEAYKEVVLPNNGYQTNNDYSKFPPLMSDGRNITASWQPSAELNEQILESNNIKSNWQYRKFMTENANTLREQMFHDSLNDVGYTIRNKNSKSNQEFNSPKLYSSMFEPVSHAQHSISDIKDNYLSRQQLQSQMKVTSLTQEQLVRLKSEMK